MRKYQRRIVNDLARVYQSNDPLRWLYLSHRFGVHRAPTRREWRMITRRLAKAATQVIRTAADAFKNLSRAISGVGTSLREMMMRVNAPGSSNIPPVAADIMLRNTIKTPVMNPRHVAIDPAALGADRSVATIHGNGMPIVILDEATNLDDETIDKMNEAIGGHHDNAA